MTFTTLPKPAEMMRVYYRQYSHKTHVFDEEYYEERGIADLDMSPYLVFDHCPGNKYDANNNAQQPCERITDPSAGDRSRDWTAGGLRIAVEKGLKDSTGQQDAWTDPLKYVCGVEGDFTQHNHPFQGPLMRE